jgi:hypothetical protein
MEEDQQPSSRQKDQSSTGEYGFSSEIAGHESTSLESVRGPARISRLLALSKLFLGILCSSTLKVFPGIVKRETNVLAKPLWRAAFLRHCWQAALSASRLARCTPM